MEKEGGLVGVRGGGAWLGHRPRRDGRGWHAMWVQEGGQGPARQPRWGRLLGRLLWAWPSEQCLFQIKLNSFKGA
jgi:hypothetical protein